MGVARYTFCKEGVYFDRGVISRKNNKEEWERIGDCPNQLLLERARINRGLRVVWGERAGTPLIKRALTGPGGISCGQTVQIRKY